MRRLRRTVKISRSDTMTPRSLHCSQITRPIRIWVTAGAAPGRVQLSCRARHLAGRFQPVPLSLLPYLNLYTDPVHELSLLRSEQSG